MTVTTDSLVIGTVTDYGDQALLLQFDSTAEVLAWTDALREADLLGVLDIVPASRTVLIKLDGPRYQGAARQQLSKLTLTPETVAEATAPTDGRADVVIDVVYDGADLDEVAKLTGLDPPGRRRRTHPDPVAGRIRWFRTGFRLPVGGDERLNVPRRSEPRTKVPAGSVGLAGEFSGVYPTRVAWRMAVDRSHRRRAVGRRPRAARAADAGAVGPVPGGVVVTTTLEVLRTGPLALIEDLGRAGLAHLGVTRSGAADRRAHTLANRLVANPGDRATIEVTFGGFTARVRGGDVAIAVTGADTDPAVNGVPFGTNSIHHAHDGQVISLGAPHSGLRTIWRCAVASTSRPCSAPAVMT